MYSAKHFDGRAGGKVGRPRGGDRSEPYDRGGRPRRGGGGGGGGRGRGGGGGRGRKEELKTAEQLDDEMDSYWGNTSATKKDEPVEVAKQAEGGAKAKGRGKKGKEEPKSAEQLDDEMDSYFGAKAAKTAAPAAAPATAE